MDEEQELKDQFPEMILPSPKIGLFVRDYLRLNKMGNPSAIHRLYKETYRGYKTQKKKTYRLCTYNSFMAYMNGLACAKLVKKVDGTTPSLELRSDKLKGDQLVYVGLTQKGNRAPDYVWEHPLRLWYRPYDWEKNMYSLYIKKE